jgi:hypothetical protein
MEFLDISSLGASYRYVVKIEKKFKQKNKWDFISANPSQEKHTDECHSKQSLLDETKASESDVN